MKNKSTVPFPTTPLRWKEGEYAILINHKDNGEQAEGEEGNRYEADFTVVKELTAEAAIEAFTRSQNYPNLDYKAIFNIEQDGKKAIDVKRDYPVKASANIFPALPDNGEVKEGEIYSYNNGAVMVVQDHNRTIYTPEETPALFSFYREVSEGKEWIPSEDVAPNSTRTYKGVTYKCLQAHKTLEGWEPDKTSTLWQVVQVTPEIPVFKQPTGVHDVYMKGNKVHFPTITDPVYESLIDNNSWSPTAYPQGWKLVV